MKTRETVMFVLVFFFAAVNYLVSRLPFVKCVANGGKVSGSFFRPVFSRRPGRKID